MKIETFHELDTGETTIVIRYDYLEKLDWDSIKLTVEAHLALKEKENKYP